MFENDFFISYIKHKKVLFPPQISKNDKLETTMGNKPDGKGERGGMTLSREFFSSEICVLH